MRDPGRDREGLEKSPANYEPLTPIDFLARTASVYPERTATVHGSTDFTWGETFARARRLASALSRRGIRRGDTVAVMLPNVPAMIECHFGIPMAGAVLNALNVRLDAEAIAFMLEHGEARALLTDPELSPVVEKALLMLGERRPQLVVDVVDPDGPRGTLVGTTTYESLLEEGDGEFEWLRPADEWDAIALNYTSGTTGNPKGVVYHHRGAYLNALSNIVDWGMPRHPVYLWTLPMFHCNGWCFPWTIAALAGTNVCLRRVEPKAVFDRIREHRVTHYCVAPIVHSMLAGAPAEMKAGIAHRVEGLVAAAAPPRALLEAMDRMGFSLTHVYGLTETYGPAAVCAKHGEWEALSVDERARLNGRQGQRYTLQAGMTVMDPSTMKPVPADGETMGEIFFRGNITMKGYLKNARATEEAFAGGWFHSGDLAVKHADGYIKIRDRSKDVIISGGENISSLEVEDVIYRHPAVQAVAVVAKPDEKWGEVPCAFVELKQGASTSERDIIEHCRQSLAHFKAPKEVVFGELPKTSTGKIQKYVLREKARSQDAIE
jgi:3-(methylthio)propionyl---CoA ligase